MELTLLFARKGNQGGRKKATIQIGGNQTAKTSSWDFS